MLKYSPNWEHSYNISTFLHLLVPTELVHNDFFSLIRIKSQCLNSASSVHLVKLVR